MSHRSSYPSEEPRLDGFSHRKAPRSHLGADASDSDSSNSSYKKAIDRTRKSIVLFHRRSISLKCVLRGGALPPESLLCSLTAAGTFGD